MGMYVVNMDSALVPNQDAEHHDLTISDSVVEMPELHPNTTHVFVTLDSGSIRVKFDGNDPAADEGHLLDYGGNATWSRRTAEKAKFIRAGGSDAHLQITEQSH